MLCYFAFRVVGFRVRGLGFRVSGTISDLGGRGDRAEQGKPKRLQKQPNVWTVRQAKQTKKSEPLNLAVDARSLADLIPNEAPQHLLGTGQRG